LKTLKEIFVNELAIIFNKLGINTNDVLAAAGTFRPGGHCIGVDLTHKYNPEIILAGRRLNDNLCYKTYD